MWQSLKKGKMEQFFVELPLARKSAKKRAFQLPDCWLKLKLDDDHCGALELHRKKSPKTIPYFKKKQLVKVLKMVQSESQA